MLVKVGGYSGVEKGGQFVFCVVAVREDVLSLSAG